jgi:glycosyltransferase involved in cell wall biosynthesis
LVYLELFPTFFGGFLSLLLLGYSIKKQGLSNLRKGCSRLKTLKGVLLLMVPERQKSVLKISIIMPVFNCVRFFERAIVSVLSQDYQHVECIVIDGGSTDGTVDIIKRYADRLAFWISENDASQSNALNKGFGYATGDVLCWLNGDEAYLPGTLTKVANVFKTNSELDIVWGNRIVIDIHGKEVKRVRYPDMSPFRFMMFGIRVLPTDATWWSRYVHNKTGCLDEKHFGRTGMDFDWLLRMSIYVRRYKHLDEYLSIFTERHDRITAAAGIHKTIEDSKFARQRLLQQLDISSVRLYLEWFTTNLYLRWFEGRLFQFPHVLKSLRNFHSRRL